MSMLERARALPESQEFETAVRRLQALGYKVTLEELPEVSA